MRIALVLLTLGLALTAPASATTVLAQDLGNLVDQSDAVLVLSVEDVRSVPVPDGSFAFTFVTFRVEERLKGSADAWLTLRFPGGEAGTYVFEVQGVPRFARGGRHLLFVQQGSLVPLAGWFQGKLDLVRHPRSGEEILVDHRGAVVSGVSGRSWRFDGAFVTPEGLFREARRPAGAILAEHGVRVTLEPEAPAETAAVPSRRILQEIRGLVAERSKLPTWRAARTLDSDSILEVPESFGFRAGREKQP